MDSQQRTDAPQTESGRESPRGMSGATEAVEDVEDISQRTRLNALLRRRRALLDTRDRVMEAIEFGEIRRERGLRMYAEKLTTMITDIYPMFSYATDSDGADIGEYYLYNRTVDEVQVTPPEGLRTSVAESAEPVAADTVQITGLNWFASPGLRVQATFEGFFPGSVQQQRVAQQRLIPFHTVDEGVRAVEMFLHEVDVDVRWDEGAEEAQSPWQEEYQNNVALDEEELEAMK